MYCPECGQVVTVVTEYTERLPREEWERMGDPEAGTAWWRCWKTVKVDPPQYAPHWTWPDGVPQRCDGGGKEVTT